MVLVVLAEPRGVMRPAALAVAARGLRTAAWRRWPRSCSRRRSSRRPAARGCRCGCSARRTAPPRSRASTSLPVRPTTDDITRSIGIATNSSHENRQRCGGKYRAAAVLPVLQQGALDQWPRVNACCPLAGLVRLLRKVFSQLSGKNREFVTHSLKYEKNAAQQVRYSMLDCSVSWQTFCWGLLLHQRGSH